MATTVSDTTSLEDVSVLVAEDDRDLTALYRTWLADTNIVRTAMDGEETLSVIDADIDVVLLDRQLPKLPGEAVLETIRERGLPCRIIVASGVEPDFDLVSMKFDGYLVKPVTREEVRTAVRRTLAVSEYDEAFRELSALSKKRTILEAQTTEHERETSERYAELERRLADVTERLDTSAGTIDDVPEDPTDDD